LQIVVTQGKDHHVDRDEYVRLSSHDLDETWMDLLLV
jgi:hypothetical protein